MGTFHFVTPDVEDHFMGCLAEEGCDSLLGQAVALTHEWTMSELLQATKLIELPVYLSRLACWTTLSIENRSATVNTESI